MEQVRKKFVPKIESSKIEIGGAKLIQIRLKFIQKSRRNKFKNISVSH